MVFGGWGGVLRDRWVVFPHGTTHLGLSVDTRRDMQSLWHQISGGVFILFLSAIFFLSLSVSDMSAADTRMSASES